MEKIKESKKQKVESKPVVDQARVQEFTEKIQALCREYKLDVKIGIFPLEENVNSSQVQVPPAQGDTTK